jgi:DNA-binding response OmpR family regulator
MTATDRVVLIGEPDQATSELYQRALHAAFDVITAPDEDTLLHLLRTLPIAALVLEPAIFAARGWERLAAISCVCAERAIPLVVCSTLDERRRGIGLGVAAYLVKPTLPATLLDTLRHVIEGRN